MALNIGGPLVLTQEYKISDSRNVGLRPRAEAPNVGGPLTIKPEFDMVARKEERSVASAHEILNSDQYGSC